jgi:putative tryptophan/tyrosine transport system substrate-binding protein
VKRREFMTLLGGATAAGAWPLVARAQQSAMPVVGFLGSGSPEEFVDRLTAFRQGLSEIGYIDGQNVRIEYRWAQGQYERLPTLAADLVRIHPEVIVTMVGTPLALAAKAATQTIPIVFVMFADAVKAGLVDSISRPTSNITGLSGTADTLITKQLQLLRELMPSAAVFALLVNPNNQNAETRSRDMRAAARMLGLRIEVLASSSENDFDSIFETLLKKRIDALVVMNDDFFVQRRERLVALAARHAIPAIYGSQRYAQAGGLMSYGPTDTSSAYRESGVYVGKILKGAKPSDLPVEQPIKFGLVVNLKTAKALGLTIPPALLARADEVIE